MRLMFQFNDDIFKGVSCKLLARLVIYVPKIVLVMG